MIACRLAHQQHRHTQCRRPLRIHGAVRRSCRPAWSISTSRLDFSAAVPVQSGQIRPFSGRFNIIDENAERFAFPRLALYVR
jgi:hypothetical protein